MTLKEKCIILSGLILDEEESGFPCSLTDDEIDKAHEVIKKEFGYSDKDDFPSESIIFEMKGIFHKLIREIYEEVSKRD